MASCHPAPGLGAVAFSQGMFQSQAFFFPGSLLARSPLPWHAGNAVLCTQALELARWTFKERTGRELSPWALAWADCHQDLAQAWQGLGGRPLWGQVSELPAGLSLGRKYAAQFGLCSSSALSLSTVLPAQYPSFSVAGAPGQELGVPRYF